MRYKNVKTGYVLVTDCKVSGEDWELIDSSVEKKPDKDEPKPRKPRGKK